MTEMQERIEIAGVLSKLDDLIRHARRNPDELGAWPMEERRWFTQLLYPVPPAHPDNRLVASDEPAAPVTIIAALLQESLTRDELRRELEKVRQLWTTLTQRPAVPKPAAGEVVRIASLLRRYFLETSPTGGIGGLAPFAAYAV